MVRLVKPQEGKRVYDPCSGSGGMLILSHEYVAEHGGNPRNLRLYGQELNGGVWSISKMNMLLHGIPDADLQNNDKGTLEDPAHLEGRVGVAATVMPHGVLFRGGPERDIREGFLKDDLLEAVIGLAPNLFYGTGIRACMAACRGQGAVSAGSSSDPADRALDREPRDEVSAPRGASR